ncbi:MAG: PKD domain-containing protein, partial [Saprospiraceae bacterium]
NGRAFDTHPFIPGQPPSRDVFYCTTGAAIVDPGETKCEAQYNTLIYAQPSGVPKPQFLQTSPPQPRAQPWRNLWYTFMLSGSGICTLKTDVLGGSIYKPLYAVYESPADADIPWATLQSTLMNPGNPIIPGLTLIKEHVDNACDADINDLIFTKSGCIRDSVRYYLIVSFETEVYPYPIGYPNQTISVSVKYDPRPTFPSPYDERTTANVVNGLGETAPPYTTVQLTPGSSMTGPDFSLLCYTANATDPPGCDWTKTRKSAWFKFEVATTGHFFGALEEIGVPGGWFANIMDLSIWKEPSPGSPLQLITMDSTNSSGHEWIDGCIDRGTYYLLVRECLRIDTIQPYRVVFKLEDSAGDFCYNAIPVNVVNTSPVTGTTLVDCHTIGTDVGEFLPVGNTCFNIPGRKTTWFHAVVNAGPMVDLNFQIGENFTTSTISLNDIAYRILAGTCGAMTPIVCSSIGTNVITLNCLGPGDYYVQVSMPEKTGSGNSPELKGSISLTITAKVSNPVVCTQPVDPNQVLAEFIYNSDCQTISLINLSTAGDDITYLWVFPDTTSTDANPVWTPPGSGTFPVTLTVTNNALGTSDTFTLSVSIINPFGIFTALADTTICNDAGNVVLNATVPGATYEWDNGTTGPTRVATTAGTYWVVIKKDGCEKSDTVEVSSIDAKRTIDPTICPESSINVEGEIFDITNPSGTVVIPIAHISGCDSILNVSLSFYPTANSQLIENICSGDTYFFGNQNLSQSGVYTDNLISQYGCDSVVTLDLSVTPRVILNRDTSGCTGSTLQLSATVFGVSYEWESGETTKTLDVSSPGSFAVSVTDANDCIISEETFAVTFGDLQIPGVAIPKFVCPGEDVLLTATGSSGDYQWFDAAVGGNLLGTGSTLLLINVQVDDTIYVQAYEPGIDNCISLRESVPFALEDDAILVALDTIVCAGSSVTLPWGDIVIPVINTSYSYAYQNIETGCDSLELTFDVSLINLPPLSLPSSFILQLGDSVLLVPQIDFIVDSIRWTPAEGLSCTDCLQPWA